MAKWASSSVLDGGLTFIKTNCNSLKLISAYTFNDNLSTIVANTLSSVAMTSSDFSISGNAGQPRVLVSASGKADSSAAAGGGGVNSHFAFCSSSEVLWVTEETSHQTIVLGNPVNYPSLTYTADQPI